MPSSPRLLTVFKWPITTKNYFRKGWGRRQYTSLDFSSQGVTHRSWSLGRRKLCTIMVLPTYTGRRVSWVKNFPLAHTHLKGQQNLKQAIEGLENTKAVWKPWHKVWKPDGVKLSLSHSDQVMPLKFWLRKARGALQAAHRHKLCVYLWKKGAN